MWNKLQTDEEIKSFYKRFDGLGDAVINNVCYNYRSYTETTETLLVEPSSATIEIAAMDISADCKWGLLTLKFTDVTEIKFYEGRTTNVVIFDISIVIDENTIYFDLGGTGDCFTKKEIVETSTFYIASKQITWQFNLNNGC